MGSQNPKTLNPNGSETSRLELEPGARYVFEVRAVLLDGASLPLRL